MQRLAQDQEEDDSYSRRTRQGYSELSRLCLSNQHQQLEHYRDKSNNPSRSQSRQHILAKECKRSPSGSRNKSRTRSKVEFNIE